MNSSKSGKKTEDRGVNRLREKLSFNFSDLSLREFRGENLDIWTDAVVGRERKEQDVLSLTDREID